MWKQQICLKSGKAWPIYYIILYFYILFLKFVIPFLLLQNIPCIFPVCKLFKNINDNNNIEQMHF